MHASAAQTTGPAGSSTAASCAATKACGGSKCKHNDDCRNGFPARAVLFNNQLQLKQAQLRYFCSSSASSLLRLQQRQLTVCCWLASCCCVSCLPSAVACCQASSRPCLVLCLCLHVVNRQAAPPECASTNTGVAVHRHG